ncbi:MAG TPA: phosphoribosylaminoimidazolesuccinocarboxamide synthase, partial [Anaerolineae bacterium]
KNDPLPQAIITPTTKATGGAHDELITSAEIVRRQLVSAAMWEQVEQTALKLFAFGQDIARQAGLVLVDTKYEFGVIDGELVLIDEMHTPDSSRFWIAESYQPGRDPQNFDKEFLREWYAAQGYRGDGVPPQMTADTVAQIAARYIGAYEKLTGSKFEPAKQPAAVRIERSLTSYK